MDDGPRTAVLAGVAKVGTDETVLRARLDELRRLCETLGLDVVGEVVQRRGRLGGTVLGEGKLKELAKWTGGTGVVVTGPPKKQREAAAAARAEEEPDEPSDGAPPERVRARFVVVDCDLTPSQVRNLSNATGATVMDRNAVIVEIFHRHARSREARLQVEIARLTYLAPRVRESGGDRQRGGIGGKGAGESQLELDRRRVRDRIAQLRVELAEIEGERTMRRERRREALTAALVGYTNAGKSSLMRALTGSDVYVADKLFATLDTTVRALVPATTPRVLLTDTVGFIQALPHDLVASFRSTLDAALDAALLVYVVDASDPSFRHQLGVTRQTLAEIGAGEVPALLALNKTDRLDADADAALRAEFPDAVLTSAVDAARTARLRDAIVAAFTAEQPVCDVVVPYDRTHVIGALRARTEVLDEVWDDGAVRYRVRAPQAVIDAILRSLGSGQVDVR
jgi:GTP-binding protein HflX